MNTNSKAHESNSPVPSHTIPLPDGRVLALEETGNPNGTPVLLLTSAPGSRRLDPDPAATAAAGIRLITVDRPGYGASSPLADGATPSWATLADDLAEAMRHLEVTRTSVVGWSNGGVGALALAATHPPLVEAVAVVGTPAPDDAVPWIPDEFRPLTHSLRADPSSAIATLTPMLGGLAADPAAAVASIASGPADDRLLERPGVRATLETMLAEAFRQGALGVVTDIAATNVAPLGFDLGSIEAPVGLWYGAEDPIIPPAHGEYYANQIAGTHLETVADTGHLVLIERWASIVAWLAAAER